jgi:hypothetical protein
MRATVDLQEDMDGGLVVYIIAACRDLDQWILACMGRQDRGRDERRRG